jgi:hypothetical protein
MIKDDMMKKYLTGLIASACVSQFAYAIDVDAGDYDYAPSNTSLGLLYYQHATRDSLYVGRQQSAANVKLDSDVAIARFARYMQMGKMQIAPQIFIPFVHLDASRDISSLGSQSNLGDIFFATTVFVYHDDKTNVGITPYVFLPTGQYSSKEALNAGENRFKFTLQAGYTTRLRDNLLLDASADFTVYADNDDAVGGGTLKQDPGYQLQTSLRYKLNPRLDLRAAVSYSNAGDTTQNQIKTDAYTQTKFSIGTAYSLTAKIQLIANYGRDLDVENGFKENNRINLRLLYVF